MSWSAKFSVELQIDRKIKCIFLETNLLEYNSCWCIPFFSGRKGQTGMYAGLAQLAARQSHNLKVVSSSLTFRIIFFFYPNVTLLAINFFHCSPISFAFIII